MTKTVEAKKVKAMCKPFRIQVGDKVNVINGTRGIVTAIGGYYVGNAFMSPMFRVGRSEYWYEWQLKKAGLGDGDER